MKIIINYDLINKIKEAQEDPKFALIKKQTKYYTIWYGVYIAFDSIFLREQFPEVLTSNILNIPILFTFYNIFPGLGSFFGLKSTEQRVAINQLKAVNSLLSLISQLGERNINTCLEYLYEAETYKTQYRIIKEEGKHHIAQNKYIMLPTETFTGDIKYTSLLQEHIIGSKEYVLSLGSPSKQFKLAHSFN